MSLTSKLSLPIRQCITFAKDQLFEKARVSLQETGYWKQWIKLTKNDSRKSIDELIQDNIMDSVLLHQDRFEILIDARGFRPEDVKCSLSPNTVQVMALKQEKQNSTTRTISLTRSYQLPQIVKPEEGICCLSSEGILLITAPWLNYN